MKIAYIPNQPHCYSFGGFEVQMLAAYDAARSAGADIELLNPWNRNSDFDIVHIWGFEITQYNNIVFSKKANKKVIISALIHDLSDVKARLRFLVSSFIYKQKILKELIPYIDCFVTVNEIEKAHIVKYYNFPASKIKVIPNIVTDTYLKNTAPLVDLGIDDFVLCVGNLSERKNQLTLVKACNELGWNVLLIGNMIEGEEKYSEAVRLELKKNPSNKWISGVKENSGVLMTAYKKCRLFALISYRESQPISVLEALGMNCKVLLADRAYAHQPFYKNADLVDPADIGAIKDALIKVHQKQKGVPFDISACTKENVGKLYADLYNEIR